MKKFLVIIICLAGFITISQDIVKLKKIKSDKEYENIFVKPYSSDKNSSSYIIWIKKDVRLHKHEHHTENLLVIEGKGELTVGNNVYSIKKGDYINIPMGTPHSLIVTSSKPMKVLSIQSPLFLGFDRIFLDNK